MWRANGNPNSCTDLDEILLTHFYLSNEGFDAGLTPPYHPWAWGPENLKPEGQRCSAGCILTPGTSASGVKNIFYLIEICCLSRNNL